MFNSHNPRHVTPTGRSEKLDSTPKIQSVHFTCNSTRTWRVVKCFSPTVQVCLGTALYQHTPSSRRVTSQVDTLRFNAVRVDTLCFVVRVVQCSFSLFPYEYISSVATYYCSTLARGCTCRILQIYHRPPLPQRKLPELGTCSRR
jgi:hypothetical protein